MSRQDIGKFIEGNMRFYNVTLEEKNWSCDSVQYNLKPRKIVTMKDEHGWLAKEQLKYDGIVCLDGINSDDEFKTAEREALIQYLKGNIKLRIAYFNAYYEDARKAGIQIQKDDPLYTRLNRWSAELMEKLEQQAPMEIELSYLTSDDRKSMGITDRGIFCPDDEKEVQRLKQSGLHSDAFEGISSAKIDFSTPKQYEPPVAETQAFTLDEAASEQPNKRGRGRPALTFGV